MSASILYKYICIYIYVYIYKYIYIFPPWWSPWVTCFCFICLSHPFYSLFTHPISTLQSYIYQPIRSLGFCIKLFSFRYLYQPVPYFRHFICFNLYYFQVLVFTCSLFRYLLLPVPFSGICFYLRSFQAFALTCTPFRNSLSPLLFSDICFNLCSFQISALTCALFRYLF